MWIALKPMSINCCLFFLYR